MLALMMNADCAAYEMLPLTLTYSGQQAPLATMQLIVHALEP